MPSRESPSLLLFDWCVFLTIRPLVCSKSDIEKALKGRNYKLVTFTHVDTSTGVVRPS